MDALRIGYVINPTAAAGGALRIWQAIDRRGVPSGSVARLTEGPLHATELTRELLHEGIRLVVAVGGDGTANEVLNGYHQTPAELRRGARIGFLPAGTGRDMARSIGVPPAAARVTGPFTGTRRIDYGIATFLDETGSACTRCFLNVASCGYSAAVARTIEAAGKRAGKLSFMAGALGTLTRLETPEVRVEVDGSLLYEGAITLVAVANGQYFGGAMMVAPEARLEDGLLDVVVLAGMRRGEVLRHLPKIYSGRHLGLTQARSGRGREISISASTPQPAPLEMDGEYVGSIDATFRVVPGGLEVAVPAGPR